MTSFLHAWLVVPAALLALCAGLGVVVARAAGRGVVPRVLVLPVGFATLITLATLLTWSETTAGLGAFLVGGVAVGGLVLGVAALRSLPRPGRAVLWPIVAGVLPAGSIAAPIVLTGQPGFTGYARIVDTAFQFDLAAHLQSAGRTVPAVIDSSYDEIVAKMLGIGYPGGAQAAHGSLARLANIDVAWAYQPFLAVLGGMLGLTLYALLGRVVRQPALRAVAAGVAAQPTILYSYALAAGIKELSAATMLILAAVLLTTRRPGDVTVRALAPAAIALAAGLAVFSLAILPWLGVLLAVTFLAEIVGGPRARLRLTGRWVILGIGTAVLSLPTLVAAVKLVPTAADGGPPDLGNLAAPVSPLAAVGVWLTADHRFPLENGGYPTLTLVFAAAVVLLATIGVWHAARRRDVGLLALATAGIVATAYVVGTTGPWVELKAFSVTAPITLALAFAGAGALATSRRTLPVGALLVAGVTVAVLGGNALVYRNATPAPYERFTELEALGERYAGRGPILYPIFEEYAEYFLRDGDPIGLVNVPPSVPPLFRDPTTLASEFVRDPDDYALEYFERFETIVLRRSPVASRPPSTFALRERTRYYEVWTRSAPPSRIVAHLPLQGQPSERDQAFCNDLRNQLSASGSEARLAYVSTRDIVSVDASPTAPDIFAFGPTSIERVVDVPETDTYRLWLRGSFGREVRVAVDGREVGTLRWQLSYPDQYEPVSTLRLSAGRHRVEIVRTGGSLLPGTGNDIGNSATLGTIGPIVFAPVGEEPTVRSVPASRAMDVCRSAAPLDWVEIVRPEGSS